MKKLISLSLLFILLFLSCKKQESSNPTANNTTTTNGTNSINLSPCTDTLVNNRVASEYLPSNLDFTTVVIKDSLVIRGSGAMGDCSIIFGSPIAAGVYPIISDPMPDTGKVYIAITTTYCSVCPFSSTEGSLYVSNTGGKFKAEFCNLRLNGNSTSYGVFIIASGRLVVNK